MLLLRVHILKKVNRKGRFVDRTPWLLCNPVSMATQDVLDADHIQYRLGSPWQQPWQPAFFYPDLQYIHDIFLDYKCSIMENMTQQCTLTTMKSINMPIVRHSAMESVPDPFPNGQRNWDTFGYVASAYSNSKLDVDGTFPYAFL